MSSVSRPALLLLGLALAACSRPRVDTEPPSGAAGPGGAAAPGPAVPAPAGDPTPHEAPPPGEAPLGEPPPEAYPPAEPGAEAPPGEAGGDEVGEPAALPTLRVLAPRGLVAALNEAAQLYTAATVTVVATDLFGILEELASHPADVVIPEGWAALEAARMAGVVRADGAVTITHLPLTVTVAGAKRDQFTSLATLTGARVGLSDPRVSSSAEAARRVLARAGVRDVTERILPGASTTALQDGTVDAILGWGGVKVGVALPVPVEVEELLPIPAAVASVTEQSAAAEAFVTWLTSDEARTVLAKTSVPVVSAGRRRTATVLPIRLPEPRRAAAATVAAGRALLLGGEAGGELLDSLMWLEVPGYKLSMATSRLAQPVQSACAAWLGAQRAVYVFGGHAATGPVDTIQRFEPHSDTIQTLPNTLPIPLERAAAEVAADRVYLFGGATTDGKLVDTLWVFDPATGAALPLDAKLPEPLADMASAPGVGTTVRLFGGTGSGGPTAGILAFDFRKVTLETLPVRLEGPRSGGRALATADGWMLVGGETPQGMRSAVDVLGRDETWRRLDVELPVGVTDAALVELGGVAHLLGGLSRERVEARVMRLPE